MAYQVTLEEAAVRLPELVRAGQEVVLLNGSQPVAKLTPFGDDGTPSSDEIAALAMAGGAFGWLADETDLYDDTCGEAILTVKPIHTAYAGA